jgi:hypothetical protein
MQEGVHMVDDQELVICSDSMTYVSITQGQVLQDDTESDKKRDIITVYWNRTKKYRDLSLEQLFYRVFINTTLKKSNSGVINGKIHQDVEASITSMVINPNEEWMERKKTHYLSLGIKTYMESKHIPDKGCVNVGISTTKVEKIFTITSEKYTNVEFLRRKHNACTVWKPDNRKTRRIYIGISSNISSQPAQIQVQE